METKYEKEQRVAFIARNKCEFNGKVIKGTWTHHVGYIKQVRQFLWWKRYVIIIAKSDEIFIVPQRDIIGIVESRNTNNK